MQFARLICRSVPIRETRDLFAIHWISDKPGFDLRKPGSVRPSRSCHKSANSGQESWNSCFFSKFWFESSKAQNMRARKIDKNWRVIFLNGFDSIWCLLKIRTITLGLRWRWSRCVGHVTGWVQASRTQKVASGPPLPCGCNLVIYVFKFKPCHQVGSIFTRLHPQGKGGPEATFCVRDANSTRDVTNASGSSS